MYYWTEGPDKHYAIPTVWEGDRVMLADFWSRVLTPRRQEILAAKLTHYSGVFDVDRIESLQMDRFNSTWADARVRVPFYRWWATEHGLPERIGSLSEIADFPRLDKAILVAHRDLVFSGQGISGYYTTGGSSGQPTKYPRGASEHDIRWANVFTARSWSGIQPLERTVHLWGHSHLFGTGVWGRTSQARRTVADRLIGMTRVNAYDLSDAALARGLDVLRRRQPAVLSGYASAIFKMASFAERHQVDIGRQPRLHAVVLCAETVTPADIGLIERVFCAPAVIEYGAAETGVIAMSASASDDIRLLWDSFICMMAAENELTLTTLDRRIFPLINYSIGDRAEAREIRNGNAFSFRQILGRLQDVVSVGTAGAPLELSAILPVHILKSYRGVIGVQFDQVAASRLAIHVETNVALSADAVRAYFIRELHRDHPTVLADSVDVVLTRGSSTTVAGKHSLFLRRS